MVKVVLEANADINAKDKVLLFFSFLFFSFLFFSFLFFSFLFFSFLFFSFLFFFFVVGYYVSIWTPSCVGVFGWCFVVVFEK